MNPLIKKEIRLLLPSFVICCALALPNFFFRFNNDGSLQDWWWFLLAFVFCGLMTVMLALNSFGMEISSGTFSNLLAQPIPRQKIWDAKIALLAVSLLIVGIFWCACGIVRLKMIGHDLDLLDLFAGVGTFGLAIFSGGLWTVLLLRQVAAAFWFTLLVPGAILAILAGLFSDQSNELFEIIVVVVLGLYSLAGLFFARWLFFRAQDWQWSGGTIAMPEIRGLPAWLSWPATKGISHPRAALWRKEIQLHQSQFVLAGALLVLHLGVLAAKKFTHIKHNSALELVVEIFWGLWLVLPMLVGAAAVAEERKLGTLEGQLCLPVKRRTQFITKFSVVVFLSAMFGVVMPLLLEGIRILPDNHFESVNIFANYQRAYDWHLQMSTAQAFFWSCVEQFNQWLPLLTLAGMATAIGAISFYASTFAKNTLQALGPAVLGIVATVFLLIVATLPDRVFNNPLWHGWLVYFVGVPIVAPAFIGLAFWNYKHVVVGGKMIGRNLFTLAAALALTAAGTTMIYHRAWEKLTPMEPPHGSARFTLSNPPKLIEQWNTSTVRLPDGRIWTDDYTLDASPPNPLAWLLGDFALMPLAGGYFLEGSNWVSVIHAAQRELVGIKTDGTLWVSEKPARRERLANGGWKMTKPGGLVRFGGETNWSSLAWNDLSMKLVKSDGTLWRWGVTNWNYNKTNEWPGLRAFKPLQLGTESNWAEVFLLGYEPCLRKTDGSVWTPLNYYHWNSGKGYQKQVLELETGFSVNRAMPLEHGNWRSRTSTWSGLGYELGVSANGTFRIWADQRLNSQSHEYEWTAVDLQFGKDTNWLAVAAYNEKAVTLKNDGTLWLWNFHHDNWRGVDADRDEREMLDIKPARLGTHSDWIAIAGTDGGIISLAADGSFWYWPLGRLSDFRYFYGNGDDSHFEPLLDISRKPQFLGNVFSKEN